MTTDSDRFDACYAEVLAWAEACQRSGWLSEAALQQLRQLETAQAEDLFDTQTQRPLLVAFFGGTGVGKSSLLNRLAGEAIAEVGVVRPTSHHVTLYLHESYRGSLHEQALPTAETRIVYHTDDARRYFAWLDMPDIDSTEQSNRAIVQQWLPLIDWLVYVVTPDRYHDDLGWQFVQSRGHEHAWLFVMNHWDEAVPEQLEDFRQRLIEQGFKDPRVLRTSCARNLPDDELKKLEALLQQALQQHGIEKLRQVAGARRWQALQDTLADLVRQVDQDQAWQRAWEDWKKRGDTGVKHLHDLLLENAEIQYRQWRSAEEAGSSKPPALQIVPQQEGDSAMPGGGLNSLFDHRCNDYLHTLGLALENACASHGLPLQPVQAHIQRLVRAAQENYLQSIQRNFADSLHKPGTRLARFLRKTLLTLQWLLPLIAAVWAGYHLVSRFYAGTQGAESFLGINFAIHSLLMIGLAWLIPWFVLRQTQPSYAKAACAGIKKGVSNGTEKMQALLQQAWDDLDAEKQDHIQKLGRIQDTYSRELHQSVQVLDAFMS